MNKYIFDDLKSHFPFIVRDAVEYIERKYDEIIIKLNNGDVVSFDTLYRTIRTMPKNSKSLSEDQCRFEFGVRLKRILMKSGMTQTDLAMTTGITQSNISSYITGKITPSFYNVDKIAKALNCSMDDFRYL